MAAIRYSDLELRYARPIAAALADDRSFRAWLLAETRYSELAADARHDAELQRQTRGRSRMTNPYWFNYWCGKDSLCTCRIGTAIETDILMIFDADNGHKFAVHVEVKRPKEKLGSAQAESYPRRAACWAHPDTRPKRIPAHSGFVTILACGSELASDSAIEHFDKVVFHEDIAEHIQVYPEA